LESEETPENVFGGLRMLFNSKMLGLDGDFSEEQKLIVLEIVESGYQTLAKKHHPDVGGTPDKFIEISKIVRLLRKRYGGKCGS
jgi:hypothetical protein